MNLDIFFSRNRNTQPNNLLPLKKLQNQIISVSWRNFYKQWTRDTFFQFSSNNYKNTLEVSLRQDNNYKLYHFCILLRCFPSIGKRGKFFKANFSTSLLRVLLSFARVSSFWCKLCYFLLFFCISCKSMKLIKLWLDFVAPCFFQILEH